MGTKNRLTQYVFVLKTSRVLLTVLFLLVFSACGKNAQFKLAEQLNRTVNVNMIIEGGRPATNKTRNLNVEFVKLRGNYKRMRVGVKGKLDQSPIVPFSNTTTVDVPDGEIDSLKEFQAELYDSANNIMYVEANIILDTVAPRGEVRGDLAIGQNGGRHYQHNDQVPVEFSAEDVPHPVSGSVSGLAPQSIWIGYTDVADCSVNLTDVTQDWISYTGNFNGFRWPGTSPTQTFYVCIFARDLADNTTTLLSQPLNAPWTVIAGDNNQGNGGSAKAPNVRFNQPQQMAIDDLGNLYITDSSFNTVRKLDVAGKITSFAGNGKTGPSSNGNALNTPVDYPTSIAFDSKGNLFINARGVIVRIDKTQKLKVWSALYGNVNFMIDKTTDTMYMSRFTGLAEQNESYIYKISVNRESASLNDFEKIAGNGNTPSADGPPAPEGPALSTPMGLPFAVHYINSSTIYIATSTDGNNFRRGHFGLRKLYKNAQGQWMSVYVPMSQSFYVTQMSYVEKGSEKYYLIAGEQGVGKLDLNSCSQPGQTCQVSLIKISNQQTGYARGVIAEPRPSANGRLYYWLAATAKSKVYRMSEDHNVVDVFGRDVYNSNDHIATQAMVNNPFGVTSDPQGNVYFVDTYNGVIRKILPNGRIELVAGLPGSTTTREANDNQPKPFTDMRFITNSFTYGYSYHLHYSPWDNSLYFEEGGFAQVIRKLDLSSRLGYSITHVEDSPFAFSLKAPVAGESFPSITFADVRTMNPLDSYIMKFDGTPQRNLTHFAGNGSRNRPVAGDAMTNPVGVPRGSRYSSDHFFYYVHEGGDIMKISPNKQQSFVLSLNKNLRDLEVFDLDGKRHIFALSDLKNITYYAEGHGSPKNLCMPGGFLNNPTAIARAHDGNLIISDTKNGRVIKYFILDTQGHLDMNFCN